MSSIENRYIVVSRKLKAAFRGKRFRQTQRQINLEKEAAQLSREIDQYGFKFFPEHYVAEKIAQMEHLVSNF